MGNIITIFRRYAASGFRNFWTFVFSVFFVGIVVITRYRHDFASFQIASIPLDLHQLSRSDLDLDLPITACLIHLAKRWISNISRFKKSSILALKPPWRLTILNKNILFQYIISDKNLRGAHAKKLWNVCGKQYKQNFTQ